MRGNFPRRILVAGASAAGLLAATRLAKAGCDVTVCEAAAGLVSTERTLIVTSRLRDVLGELAEPSIRNVIRHYELCVGDRRVALELGLPDLVIERTAVVRAVAAHAVESGVRIQFGRRFESLTGAEDGVRVGVRVRDNGSFQESVADVLIGADGAYSRVASAAGLPRQPLVPLLQALVRLPPDLPADTTRVWFEPGDTSFFYWLIPDSPTHGVLGMIADDPRTARFRLDRFLARQELRPLQYQGSRIPEYLRWLPCSAQVGAGAVHLVGDAAGHVKVTTIGGLVTGLWGALGVADTILEGHVSRGLKEARRELDSHMLIRRALKGFDREHYSRLLDRLSPSVRRLLARYTRDEGKQLAIRLALGHPRLVAAGLRPLIGSFFSNAAVATAAGANEEP